MANVETPTPATPRKLRAIYEVSPDRMRIAYRPRSFATFVFLPLWLIGWTAGCVMLTREVIDKPQLTMILFGIPFWSSWVFVFCVIVGAFTRRQTLEVDRLGLRYIDRALVRLKNRWVPRDELKDFSVVERATSHSDDAYRQTGLEIRTAGKPLFVFDGLPDEELRWLAYQLSQLVEALPPAGTPAESLPQIAAAPRDALGVLPQTLALSDKLLEPPSDCSWELLPDFGAVCFGQRGRWKWMTVLGLLFINCFWNGIVGVFVVELLGGAGGFAAGPGWWFSFFFLIPFEVIGLAMLVGLVLAILEPVRRTNWCIDQGEIEYRCTWLGLGPRWSYPFESLARLELVHEPRSEKARFRAQRNRADWAFEEERFSLSFIQPDNAELCRIESLTEGEARWMADVVMRQWPEWFR